VNVLDRSLSQSFAEESKLLSSKLTPNQPQPTLEEEMPSEEEVCVCVHEQSLTAKVAHS
jgi:hypothetical protein